MKFAPNAGDNSQVEQVAGRADGNIGGAAATYIDLLGPLRFLMAVSVVIFHLWGSVAIDAGRHAVIGFFCISGFLITRVSATAYRGRAGAFLMNRFLRIYPQYALSVLCGAAVVIGRPHAALAMNAALRLPVTILEWSSNIFIFGLSQSPARLSPSTWSLNVELYFYLAIGLVTYRSERATYLVLFVSCIAAGFALLGIGPVGFYGNPFGNAFVFYLGSAAFFLSKRVLVPAWLSLVGLILYFELAYLFPWLGDTARYRNGLLVISSLTIFLILLRTPRVETRLRGLRTFASFLGRLSYPIFLIHWAAAGLVFALIGARNPRLFFATLAVSLLFAGLMVLALDRPVEKIRSRIRAVSRTGSEPSGQFL